METTTHALLTLWMESRTRFSDQITKLSVEDLLKKLTPSQNSIGFLMRHIGDVEFLFAKNVFGLQDLKVSAKTLIAQHDTGEWTDLNALIEYTNASYETLKSIIESQGESDWSTTIVTKEFGSKTKAQALGRITSHTAYHAGQLAIIQKYGQ
jgi:uncharacterized damage-inducible protein DinB